MIEAICINDKNKPSGIPSTRWVKEGETYHITYIYRMVNMDNILGCTLKEIDLMSLNMDYVCFKLDRFAIRKEDLQALIELAKDCAELSDLDVGQLLEEQIAELV